MKKLVVLGMGVCMVLAFASCKSSESAYKKAYEKAKQQEEELRLRKTNRKAKEVFDFGKKDVWIDGFNQIITLEVLLNHSPLFLGMDGVVRDLASLRGNYRIIPQTKQAVALLLEWVYAYHPGTIHILLDAPVSNSGRLKTKIYDVDPMVDVQIVQHVDLILYEKANVITSDSIILDSCISWFNLMVLCLKKTHFMAYDIEF